MRNGATSRTESQVPPPTPPISQSRARSTMSLRVRVIALMKEVSAATVADPARASFSGVAPPWPRDPMR